MFVIFRCQKCLIRLWPLKRDMYCLKHLPKTWPEWTVFKDRKADIPDDKILVPGVVDTTTNFVEHPDLVAQDWSAL